MKRLALSFLLAAIPLAALAQSAAPREMMIPDTVSVTGTGRATLAPDRFTFTVGVQTVAPTVEEAVNLNNEKVAAAIASLKKAGAADKEIRTSNFSIWPQQEYGQGKLPRIVGYQVSNNVTVTRDKIGDAGRLLQVAIGAGVNQSSGLQFEISDPARGRDQGLKAAFDDARAKAALLAQAAGRILGGAISISEGAEQVPPRIIAMPARAMAAKAEAVSEIPVESGTQEFSYTISVVFALK